MPTWGFMRMRKKPLCVILIVALLTIVSAHPRQVQAMTKYHTEKSLKHEEVDVTLNWDVSLLRGGWREFCLWDNWLTHCYISFKYGLDASLEIPATLYLSYPDIVEPGDSFQASASLSLFGTRILTISPEFLLKIQLMLPVPVYIPNVGWIRNFQNTFGGKWTFSFNINSRQLGDFIDQIFLGDPENLETYSNALELPSFIHIQSISYNPNTLGELVSGKIRVDFLEGILDAAETLSITNPASLIAIRVLRWLVQDVFHTSTGLLITPKLSACIDSPITADSRVQSLGSSSLRFESEMSKKVIPASVSSTSAEGQSSNYFSIDLSPFMYRLLFDVDWDYYFNVNLDVLGVSLYKNTWLFDLLEYPKLSWDAHNVKQSIPFTMKLDDPLEADDPQSGAGTISIELDDKAGIETVELKYSTDKALWQSVEMKHSSSTYYATPSVPEETKIYYYIAVTDGDGDTYELNNDGLYFNYILPAQNPLERYLRKVPAPILIGIPIIVTVVVVAAIVSKRRANRGTQRKGRQKGLASERR